MTANLIHTSATRKSLEIPVAQAEVDAAYKAVVAKVAGKVRIPGFRPGKAPKDVLMKRYEQEILSEVAEILVGKCFLPAAQAVGVSPISRPGLETFEVKEGADGKFRVVFDVAPEVILPSYSSLSLVKKKRRIDDAAVAEQIEALREQRARFIPVEDGAALGHYATLDIKVKPAGMKSASYKDQVIQLAEGRPFDEKILGMKADETRTFAIAIPEDDPNKAMAGKQVNYEATLKDLRRREVPELNLEFAKDLGDHADLDAFKAWVRSDLEEAAERDAEARLQATVLDTLLDAAPFEVPASMVSLQLDDYCNEFAQTVARQGVDPKRVNWQAYRQSRQNDAERAVRSGYLLQTIGNTEDIQVSDEEIDGEIRAVMAEHQIQQPFEAFKASLVKRGSDTEIRGRVRTEKIFTKIIGAAKVTEELLDKDAFAALVELERRREAGIPQARYDAGGVEGGELEAQEGGAPAAVAPAEHVHGPDCDHSHDEPAAEAAPAKKPRAPRKPKAEAAE